MSVEIRVVKRRRRHYCCNCVWGNVASKHADNVAHVAVFCVQRSKRTPLKCCHRRLQNEFVILGHKLNVRCGAVLTLTINRCRLNGDVHGWRQCQVQIEVVDLKPQFCQLGKCEHVGETLPIANMSVKGRAADVSDTTQTVQSSQPAADAATNNKKQRATDPADRENHGAAPETAGNEAREAGDIIGAGNEAATEVPAAATVTDEAGNDDAAPDAEPSLSAESLARNHDLLQAFLDLYEQERPAREARLAAAAEQLVRQPRSKH